MKSFPPRIDLDLAPPKVKFISMPHAVLEWKLASAGFMNLVPMKFLANQKQFEEGSVVSTMRWTFFRVNV